ncbi:MAG TPA: CpaD family pilus assembly protein [Novosphingobium sp.]
MRTPTIRAASATGLALTLALGLGGCADTVARSNRMLESVRQPVVERTNYTLDLASGSANGSGGLSLAEQRRLAGWFEALDLRYGDRIAIDDPLASSGTRAAVEDAASRYGILLSEGAPVTEGYVNAGTARVIVSRTVASVPGCPNWSKNSEFALNNETSTNFGCGVNGSLAAMVANPEHLVKGAAARGDTVVMSSNKAIDAFRQAAPTGGGSTTVKATATK